MKLNLKYKDALLYERPSYGAYILRGQIKENLGIKRGVGWGEGLTALSVNYVVPPAKYKINSIKTIDNAFLGGLNVYVFLLK